MEFVLNEDIKKIEKVHKRATEILYGFSQLEYEEKLRRLNLTSLEDRRIRGDIIELYKIVKGNEGIEWIKAPRLRSEMELKEPTKRVRGKQSKDSKKGIQVT